jgi:hypothetical protein
MKRFVLPRVRTHMWGPLLLMLALALVIAGGLSYFASTHPDGLERVAEDHRFMDRAREPSHTVMPGYTIPGLHGFLSNGLAGIIGVAATFAVVTAVVRLARKRRTTGAADGPIPQRR